MSHSNLKCFLSVHTKCVWKNFGRHLTHKHLDISSKRCFELKSFVDVEASSLNLWTSRLHFRNILDTVKPLRLPGFSPVNFMSNNFKLLLRRTVCAGQKHHLTTSYSTVGCLPEGCRPICPIYFTNSVLLNV